MYIQNGCKNWALINKHAAMLEKECKGKLPKKAETPKLLNRVTNMEKSLVESSDSSSTDDESFTNLRGFNSRNRNPAKTMLEQHGVKFPVGEKTQNYPEPSSPTPPTVYRCAPSNKQEEQEQLNMVLNQSMLEHQQSISYAAQGNIPVQFIQTPLYYPQTLPPVYTPPQTVLSTNNLIPSAAENPFNQAIFVETQHPAYQTLPEESTAVMDNSAVGKSTDNVDDGNDKGSETAAEELLTLMGV